MNPGMGNEVGKVAQAAVNGLAKSPLALALMLFNLLVLGGVFWLVHSAAERQEQRFQKILETCIERRPQ